MFCLAKNARSSVTSSNKTSANLGAPSTISTILCRFSSPLQRFSLLALTVTFFLASLSKSSGSPQPNHASTARKLMNFSSTSDFRHRVKQIRVGLKYVLMDRSPSQCLMHFCDEDLEGETFDTYPRALIKVNAHKRLPC